MGELTFKDCLGCLKTSRPPHSPTTTLEIDYTEACTGFSHMYRPDSLSNTVPHQVAALKSAPLWERWEECTFQGQGRKRGAAECRGPVRGSTSSHVPLMAASDSSPRRPALTICASPCSAVCPKWSARSFISTEEVHLPATRLHWKQRP